MKNNGIVRLMLFTVVCFGFAALFAKMAGDEKITAYWEKVADKLTNQGNYVSIFTQNSFPADNLDTLKIIGTEHDVRIERSKDKEIHFSYYKKNEGDKLELVNITGTSISIGLNKLNSPKNRFKINFNFNSDENPGLNVQDVNQLAVVVQVPGTIKKLKVETVSGEIRAHDLNFDEVTLDSVSGDIKLRGDFLTMNLSTVSGDVKFISERTSTDARFQTVSGNVNIGFHEQPALKLTFNTTSGDMKIDKAFGGGEFQGDVKELKIGAATGNLSVETVSGDLQIEKTEGAN